MLLRFEHTGPAPLPGCGPSVEDKWNHRLSLTTEDGEVVVLLQGPIDGAEFIEWLRDSEDAICTERAPYQIAGDENLAEAFEQEHRRLVLEGEVNPDSSANDNLEHRWVELMEYRERHCSVFGMQGMRYPYIWFGLGARGPEVSCIGAPGAFHEDEYLGDEWKWWHYPVDYPEFFAWVRRQYPVEWLS